MLEYPVIAIETSSRIGSIALGMGKTFLGQTTFNTPLRHSTELLPGIQSLLAQHKLTPKDIELVCISIGPGSFTGLRIAVTTAKIMALANQTEIVPVNTLDAIATNVTTEQTETIQTIAPIIDAKRNKFFVAGYKAPTHQSPHQEVPEKILEDHLMTPESFSEFFKNQPGSVGILGDGLVYYAQRFSAENVVVLDQSLWGPQAAAIFHLGVKQAEQGLFADPMTLIPNYLRSAQATPKSTL